MASSFVPLDNFSFLELSIFSILLSAVVLEQIWSLLRRNTFLFGRCVKRRDGGRQSPKGRNMDRVMNQGPGRRAVPQKKMGTSTSQIDADVDSTKKPGELYRIQRDAEVMTSLHCHLLPTYFLLRSFFYQRRI